MTGAEDARRRGNASRVAATVVRRIAGGTLGEGEGAQALRHVTQGEPAALGNRHASAAKAAFPPVQVRFRHG